MILKLSSADELVVVGSGREALTAIKKVHPDVLICDLAMPEMDGYELLENVRGLEAEIGHLAAIACRLQIAAKIEVRPNELVLQRISSNRSIPMNSSRQS